MNIFFLKSLIYNILLLLGVGFAYSELNLRPAAPSRSRELLNGAILGAAAIAIMLNPWVLSPGRVFDVRSVLLSVAGLFFSPLSALVAAIIAAGFRINLGGAGVLMGVSVICSSTLTGILWRRYRPLIAVAPSLAELYLFGLTVHLAMLAGIVFLPGEMRLDTLYRIALPVLVVYPLGVVLFGLLFIRQSERERDRLALAESEERYRAVSEFSNNAICIVDDAGKIVWVNGRMTAMGGFSREDYLSRGSFAALIAPESLAFVLANFKKAVEGLPYEHHYRFSFIRADGEKRLAEKYMSDYRDRNGRLNLVISMIDITDQLRLEQTLRQSQKMEAVGSLAGGVAHDFNNILTAITGYCSLITAAMAPDDRSREDMKEIVAAADRATTLTRQLLAFSRRQILAPVVVDLNKTISDMTKMLRRLIGEDKSLSAKLFGAPCLAKVDPGQMEQVIMNLVVNARDAVSGNGEISLETEILRPRQEFFSARPDLQPGDYVCIRVRDNGCGMSAEVKAHVFEPFFTTKEPGKGTGLGLSVVFGIVKQSGGDMEVETAPGRGSVFSVYFPLARAGAVPGTVSEESAPPAGGKETILLVEDEESLCRLGERLLRAVGYTVLSAPDGKEALKLMAERGKPVDLLITDVVMPGMNGRELAKELVRLGVVGRTLYMSGYTDEAITKHGVLEPGIAFIYKPFTTEGLTLKIREVLEGAAGDARP